ncbi:alpha/beta-hydrolase [Dichomitus squalens LYAD-421 SS1]|uniref:alpha/beta-hydrolase n=1 Tax=Dichomitus squalens (strain LYAD-421) TaxID=732165 RepID=UPI0004412FF3|nr:alpha/beta-hydrolase [Dichomitus squalens LYAD-421 SS1]EJF66096.1 alpha/beta-hydrolase [Dichomitus squalens LYAD-421 SS1]
MRILASLLPLLLSAISHTASTNAREGTTARTPISFELHTEYTPRLEDGDVRELSEVAFEISTGSSQRPSSTVILLQATPTTVHRPRNAAAFQHARVRSSRFQESEPVEWEEVQVLAPDVEDKHTLSQLARMTGNAYALPGRPNWYDIDPAWNTSFPFGWEDKADGFRGHVFLSPDNATVVLSIKGTTLQGPSSKKDKFNDNLLFSCCCARVDITWIFHQVCDCYAKHWRCDNTCLTDALVQDSLFYNIGVGLVNNLTALYPNADIWLVGHSLGGSLASLLGATFGLPAVAFEAPGERLAAQRLHLPFPPPTKNSTSPSPPAYGRAPVTHVYHNADPIPQGVCTGAGSPCAQAGYALETRCHLGRSIVYDTVGKLGWRVDIRKHVIKEVITHVIEAEPEGGWDDDNEVPVAKAEDECLDCFKWEFGEFKDRDGDDD